MSDNGARSMRTERKITQDDSNDMLACGRSMSRKQAYKYKAATTCTYKRKTKSHRSA